MLRKVLWGKLLKKLKLITFTGEIMFKSLEELPWCTWKVRRRNRTIHLKLGLIPAINFIAPDLRYNWESRYQSKVKYRPGMEEMHTNYGQIIRCAKRCLEELNPDKIEVKMTFTLITKFNIRPLKSVLQTCENIRKQEENWPNIAKANAYSKLCHAAFFHEQLEHARGWNFISSNCKVH